MSALRLTVFFLIVGMCPSGFAARSAYYRASIATSQAPAMNIGTPIPATLSDLFGPGAPNLSDRERAQKELAIYLEDPAYAKYMTERLRQAADRVPDATERARLQKLTISDLVRQWKKDFPKISYPEMALALASLEFGSPSVLGRMDPELCQLARQSSKNNAKAGKIAGRANWIARAGSVSAKFRKEGMDSLAEENEGETSNLLGSAIMAHAQECVRTWWYNAQFHTTLTQYHSLACPSMTKAPGGGYFCVANYINYRPHRPSKG